VEYSDNILLFPLRGDSQEVNWSVTLERRSQKEQATDNGGLLVVISCREKLAKNPTLMLHPLAALSRERQRSYIGIFGLQLNNF